MQRAQRAGARGKAARAATAPERHVPSLTTVVRGDRRHRRTAKGKSDGLMPDRSTNCDLSDDALDLRRCAGPAADAFLAPPWRPKW